MALLICLICHDLVQVLSSQKSNATCSANSHVSVGANSYGIEEHAWRACRYTCQAMSVTYDRPFIIRLNYTKTRPIAALWRARD